MSFGGKGEEPAENPSLTLVDLIWQEKRVEHWLRFGRICHEHRLDRQHRTVGFAPGSVFALVRWAGNDYGTVVSRLDILRAVGRGEPFQTLPFIRPGAEILLRVSGWPKVERVLQAVDAIEALGIDAHTVSPEHWRHVHNRIAAGEPFRSYTRAQHAAWLKRRKVGA
ncbi:glycosidase [Paracoccus versutus]|nr:glycosidase [Paracoccus versutus]